MNNESLPEYLYRFDRINAIALQGEDNHLRARRKLSKSGDFQHDQANEAIDLVKPGEGVFCLSFWKSWESLIKHLFSHQSGCLIQRIKSNHHVFNEFKFGDDQYLKDDAWFLWATLPIDENRPNWSPIGIHHSDIEVLHPGGRWMPMSMVPAVGQDTFNGWHREYFSSDRGPAPVYYQTALRTTADGMRQLSCVIRQRSGSWPSLINQQFLLADLIKRIHWQCPTSMFIDSWYIMYEEPDQIIGYEIKPVFKFRETRLQKLFRLHIGQSYQDSPFLVSISSESYLSPGHIARIYDDFHATEALRRGKAWRYDLPQRTASSDLSEV